MSIILDIAYVVLLCFDVYLLSKKQFTNDDILLVALSIFLFLIPFFSLFFSKGVHHLLYKAGRSMFRQSEIVSKSEVDSFKKYEKICVGLLAAAIVFVLLSILIKLVT